MSVTKAELTGLYLSYFGRPPDPGGLDYYLAQPDATVVSVAAAFSVSPESLALLGPVFGAAQVDSIYMNLFGRHAEPDGLSYWVGQVSSGALSPAMAAYGIFLGAQNDDKISVQNKMAIATLFTAHLDTPDEIANYNAAGAESAREFLALVGSSAQSLATATANIDFAVAAAVQAGMDNGPTFSLSADAGQVKEGDDILFTLHSTGIAPGVQFTWTITGVQADDVDGALTGTITVGTDGNGKVTVAMHADTVVEGIEKLTLSVAGQHVDVNIKDDSGVTPVRIYTVNATENGTNDVFRNGADTGSPNATSFSSKDQLIVGGTSDLGNLSHFKNVTFEDGAVLGMSVTTYQELVGAQKFNASGTQTVTLFDSFSGTLNGAIESYVLADAAGNDVTLAASGQNVTGAASQDDIVRTGSQAAVTGTIDLGGSKGDQLVVTTSADISAADLVGVSLINLDTDANATMTIAQNALVNTAAGTNTITLTDAGTTTGNAEVESYVLGGAIVAVTAPPPVNDFTLGAGAQNVTGQDSTDDTVHTASFTTITGNISLGAGGTDVLVISTDATDISGATLTGVEQVNLDTDVSATMKVSQNDLVNTAAGTNTITLSDAGTTTGAAEVESYVLSGAGANDFTLGAAAQAVTGQDAADDTVRTGTLTSVTGAISLGAGGTDQLVVTTDVTDISGATLTGVEQVNLDTDVGATMTIVQNGLLNTAAGTNAITLSDAGTTSGNANVESYVLSGAGANDFTLGTAAQGVTGQDAADDIVRTGTLATITGAISLGAGGTDQLVVTTDATDISGATLTDVEQVNLDSDVGAKMTIAQNALVTTATGTNTVTLTDAGATTGAAEVESYELAALAGNNFTLGAGGQNVTGNDSVDETVRTGTQTSITGKIHLGTGDADKLVVSTTGTDISTADLVGVDLINLATDVDATMTLAQHGLLNNANGTNKVTLTDSGTLTGSSNVESYVLADTASNDFTLGKGAQSVTGANTHDDVVHTGTITNVKGTIDLGGHSTGDQLIVETTGTDISAATLLNIEQINLASNVDVTMTIAQHAQLNTATDTNQVTFADNGTVTGHADVETYELSGAGANDFTMAATGQNVTGHGGDDVVHTASLTSVTGIIKLDGGTDQLVIETSADINTATLTGVDQINLAASVNVSMTIAQNKFVNTAAGSNTITLTDAGTTTGAAAVAAYVLADGAANIFTLGGSAQNVTATGTQDDTVKTGALTSVTGTIDLGAGTADQVIVTTTADISGATLTGVEQLNLGNGISATINSGQHSLLNNAGGNNTITFSDAVTLTGNANIKAYVLAAVSKNDFTLATSGQDVTGQDAFDDIVRTGGITNVKGNINLGTGDTDTLVITTTGTNISNATLTGVEQIDLDSGVTATMTVAQNAFVNNADGTNTVVLSDAGTTTGAALVGSYKLSGSGSNDFTLGATGQNVTGQGADDIVRTGALSSVTGTIKLDGGTDQLVIESTADISTATLNGVDQINLGANTDATMTIAQNAFVNTAGGSNTITLSDAGAATGAASVASYKLADAAGNVFTLGASGQNVTGATQDDTVDTGSLTSVTGTIDLGGQAGFDQLLVSTSGADISTATLTNVEQINLAANVSVTMNSGQHAILANGTKSNTVTFTDAANLTGNITIESYVLAGASGNDFTLATGAQNVTGQDTYSDIVRTGGITNVKGTISLGTGDTDQLVITTTGTNISQAVLTGVEQINLGDTVDATMTVAYNAFVSAADNLNTITLTDAGTTKGAALVESYKLADAAGNDFTLGASGQNVLAQTADDKVRTGLITSVTGIIKLGAGSDELTITTTGTDISQATLNSVEFIELDNGVNATMTRTENGLILNAGASNTVTLTDSGAATGAAQVENYILADLGNNSFTIGAPGQNVTGGATANDTLVGSGTLTGTYVLGGGSDSLKLNGVTDVTGASLGGVDTINLQGFNLTINAAQHNAVGFSNGAGSVVTIADAVATTANDNVKAYVLGNTGNSTITFGGSDGVRAGQSVNLGASGGTDTVVVNNAGFSAGLPDRALTVTNFVGGAGADHDVLTAQLAGVGYTGFTNVAGGTSIAAVADNSVLVVTSSGFVTLSATADGDVVEQAIAAAIGDYLAGNVTARNYTVIVYSGTGISADAGIYTMRVTGNANTHDLATNNFNIEHIATLVGVGADTLTGANFA